MAQPNPSPPPATIIPIPRTFEFALFLTALAWVGAAFSIAGRSAQGLTVRFNLLPAEPLLEALFLLFLTVLGFRALDLVAARGREAESVLPLPPRATCSAEWGLGAAVGWALALAAVLPLLVTLHLHTILSWPPGTSLTLLLSLATLLALALAEEVIFRGYPFARLSLAIGSSAAAIVLSVLFAALLLSAGPAGQGFFAFLDSALFGLLLALAYLRTHALWLGWGLHFARRAATAILIGLPIAGHVEFGSFAQTYAGGPRWLSGGAFGPDAAVLTALLLLAAFALLYRLTRDYAWTYTRPPIIAAGYEVNLAPPAAHAAMEQAVAPPPLVQILPTTPQAFSATPPPPKP